MAKILFEATLDASGAVTGMTRLKEGLSSLGTANTAAAKDAQGFDRSLGRLVDRLEPGRVAMERLHKQQEILRRGFQEGRIDADRYARLNQQLTQSFDPARKSSADLAEGLQVLAGRYRMAAMAAVAAAVVIGREAVNAFAAAEESSIRLEAVLRATGGASGLSSREIKNFARDLQDATGVSSVVVQDAAAVLATFKNVGRESFAPALEAAMDLSVVLQGNLKGSVLQVAKALEDPVRGMGQLREVGVSFTHAQESQIKALVESNDLLKAQGVILEVFKGQVGGVARELGGSLNAQLALFKERLREIKEEFGKPGGVLTGFLQWLNDSLKKPKSWDDIMEDAAGSADTGPPVDFYFRDDAVTGSGQKYLDAWRDAALKQKTALRGLGEEVKALNEARKAGFVNEKEYALILADIHSRQEKLLDPEKKRAKAAEERVKAIQAETKVLHALSEEFENLARESGRFGPNLVSVYSALSVMAPDFATMLKAAAGFAAEVAESGAVLDRLVENIKDIAPVVAKYPWQKGAKSPSAAAGYEENRDFKVALTSAVAAAFTDGILASLKSGNTNEAIGSFGQQFAAAMTQMAATRLDVIFQTLIRGGSGRESMQAAGLWDPSANEGRGGVSWASVAQLGGGMLMSYGQQRGNRTAAVVGGAISGAATGSQMGAGAFSWVGAIVGAIVGGVMGYISSEKKLQKVELRPLAGGRYLGVDVQGLDKEASDELARTWVDRVKKLNLSFREIYRALEQAVPDFAHWMPEISRKVADFSSFWKALLERELPDVLFEQFRPGLEAALKGMGVGDKRIIELMSAFSAGNFDEAGRELLEYIQTYVALRKATTEYGKSLADLRDEANRSQWDQWSLDLTDTTRQLGELLEELPKLTSEEQVARAQELLELTNRQYEANIRLFRELEAMRQAAITSLAQYTEGREMATADRGGWQASSQFLQRRFGRAVGELGDMAVWGGGTPEGAQRALDDAFRFGQALQSLADSMEAVLPEFETLKTQFEEFAEEAARPLSEVLAEMGRGVRQAFVEDSTKTISRIRELREGLGELAPLDYLSRLRQIGELQREQYDRQIAYVRALAQAQQQLNASIDAQLGNIRENELAKQGKDVIGQYYVDQMQGLWEALQSETDPMRAKEIADQILAFAQKLYGLDPDIMLQIGEQTMGAGEWLTGLLENLREVMNARFDKAGDEAQNIADTLLDALAGLTLGIDTKRTELEEAIDTLRRMVDIGLIGAVENFDQLMREFQATIVDQNMALKEALDAMIAALSDAALSINTFFGPGGWGDPGDPGGGGGPIEGIIIIEKSASDAAESIGALGATASNTAAALGAVAARLTDLSNLTITIEVPPGINVGTDNPQLVRIVQRNPGIAA